MAQKYLRSCIRIISTYQDHQKRKCCFNEKRDHKSDLFIFLPNKKMCYMPENRPNRPTPTYPNIGDFNRISDWFPKSAEIDHKERRIRDLEKEVAELRRYKEEQEEKENPRVRQYRKKPVVIEAVRFTTETNLRKSFPDIEIWNGMSDSVIEVYIKTLEGKMKISE
nr:MAG TPA: sensory box protein [Caudoviricetes sp.]DAS61490.1 MAG TPA: sensory box protein [Caudoviricetes sp.]